MRYIYNIYIIIIFIFFFFYFTVTKLNFINKHKHLAPITKNNQRRDQMSLYKFKVFSSYDQILNSYELSKGECESRDLDELMTDLKSFRHHLNKIGIFTIKKIMIYKNNIEFREISPTSVGFKKSKGNLLGNKHAVKKNLTLKRLKAVNAALKAKLKQSKKG